MLTGCEALRSKPVAVLGARGKTGRAITAALQQRGRAALPLGRAELAELDAALADVEELYLMAPNMHSDEPALIRQMLEAAEWAGVKRVVYHSVAAPYAPEMPHHLGKAESERLIRMSKFDWTILQPCAYIQNFLPALQKPKPQLAVAYGLDAQFGLIDLADVGEVAATALTDESLIGATVELGGPELVSVRDVAATASRIIGREVPAKRVEPTEWSTGPGAELNPRERDWLLAMFEYYDAHGLPAGPLATRAILGREPNALEVVLARKLGAATGS